MDVVAVTGTKGKTTTSWWCAQLLHLSGKKCGYVGSTGTGVCGAGLAKSGYTTPGVLEVHESLAGFAKAGCAAVVIEASSHGLEQGRLDGVDCDVAVFTNLGSDHLDHHGTMEGYLASKSLLFQRPEIDCAVYNQDDDNARSAGEASVADERVGCGTGPGAAVRWSLVTGGERVGVRLKRDGRSWEAPLPAPGRHNAANLSMAVAAASYAGLAFGDAGALVGKLSAPPGRTQLVEGGGINAYVDFAHTPESLEAVLVALREQHPDGRLLCVFGCGGNRDGAKRPLMGEVASRLGDAVFITTDNPREEDPADIARQVAAGAGDNAEVVVDRGEAIARAVSAAKPGDTVLVAGKGEEAAIVGAGGKVVPFDDATRLREELSRR